MPEVPKRRSAERLGLIGQAAEPPGRLLTDSRAQDEAPTAEDNSPTTILVAASGFIFRPTASINLGDHAQLSQTLEKLTAHIPKVRIIAMANSMNDESGIDGLTVSYSGISYLTAPVRVPILQIFLPTWFGRSIRGALLLLNARRSHRGLKTVLLSGTGHAALRTMVESDALFISGAGAINDRYLTGPGGVWCLFAACMRSLKKPVVASGQQIGPLQRPSRRLIARWALRSFDLLGVRDRQSLVTSARLGVHERHLVLTGDDAWDLAPSDGNVALKVLEHNGVAGPFLACQIRFGPSVGWTEEDAPALAASLSAIATELNLPAVFFACSMSRLFDDRAAAGRVSRHMTVPSCVIRDQLDAPTVKALLGLASIGVGTANHFTVFAASMRTPVIALHASPYMRQKIVGLSELWPTLIAALPKASGLDPAELVATGQRLLELETGRLAQTAPSIETHPNAPVLALKALMKY